MTDQEDFDSRPPARPVERAIRAGDWAHESANVSSRDPGEIKAGPPWVGVLVLMAIPLVILIALSTSGIGNQEAGTSRSTGSVTPAAKQTSQSSTQGSISSRDCTSIETNITMVRTAFTAGNKTPQQIAILLNSAAGDWAATSLSYSGSRADWLRKMSGLSKQLRSYVLTGTPSNGPQILDQLGNNFGLFKQFCN